MSRWFWYVAAADELMMDCDGRVLLEIAQSRLQRDLLPVKQTFVAPSQKQDHFHFVVRLQKPMPVLERMVWQLYLMDHVFRSVKNLFRALEGNPAPSLLISPEDWAHIPRLGWTGWFWRTWDATCDCPSHKDWKTIDQCPAHYMLRGLTVKSEA